MKRFLLLFVTLCFALSGCFVVKPPENPELKKVTVVLDWIPNTNHTGMYLAKDLGYYAEVGLDVEIIQPPEDGAVALVAGGKADFGVSFQEEIAFALDADEPMPVTAVAAILQHNTSGIISLKDKGITSPKGLEGKKYATWDMPVEKAILKSVIESDGGSFDKVKMIPSTVTDVITALQTNVDAVWIYYGWDGVAAEVKGLDTNYFDFRSINPVLDFYTPILISGNDFLKNNGETAKKFLAATAKGYEYAVANPKEAAECLVRNAPETDLEIAIKSQEFLSGEYIAEAEKWGVIDPERWSGFYTWLFERGLTKKLLGTAGFTNEYLK
ncbi:MAG: putative thiamine biosynthesis protein [Firmicutes bacterium ADurb.Bin193]|nr:MAG: putative thiamine biosynthesis protein [Firmicutes bacterium ADurb.Bin193]